MKNNVKKHSFLKGMLIYAGIFLTILAIGLVVFWKYIEAYELSRPSNTIETYMNQLTGEYVCDRSEELLNSLDENLQSREEASALICQEIAGGVTYAKKTSACTDTQLVYMLRCGSHVIGSVTMTPGQEGGFGFTNWQVTQESFDMSYLLSKGVEITVPAEFVVTVNGVALDESYITDDSVHYSVLEAFYDDYNLPVMVAYQTPSILGEAIVAVVDADGQEVDLRADGDRNVFLHNCTEAECAELETFCGEFIARYVAFTGGANGSEEYNYHNLMKYVVKDSELARRMFQAMDGLTYAQSQGDKIAGITINHEINLGDDRYLCDITYLVDTTGWEGVVQTTNNIQIIIVRTEDGLLVEALTSY